MSRPRTRLVCMVVWPGDPTIGTVRAKDGKLWVEWPDGGNDCVFRAADGSLWDEYGDDLAPLELREHGCDFGTRLEVYG